MFGHSGTLSSGSGDPETGYEWPADAIAFGIGSVVGSEFIVATRTSEPVRMATGGTYTTHHRPVSA